MDYETGRHRDLVASSVGVRKVQYCNGSLTKTSRIFVAILCPYYISITQTTVAIQVSTVQQPTMVISSAPAVPRAAMGMAGRFFFGSLCAGTFGLGTWQALRYRNKVALVEQRTQDLQQEPVVYGSAVAAAAAANDTSTSKDTEINFRRLQFTGRFQHEREFLVGPRGPPKDALPQGPGTSSGGLSSAPQGFIVLTPMVLDTNNSNQKITTTMVDSNDATILVNRGWVPMQQVNSYRYGRSQSQQRYQQLRARGEQTTKSPSEPQESSMLQWDRPTGDVTITAVPGTFEGGWNVAFALLLRIWLQTRESV